MQSFLLLPLPLLEPPFLPEAGFFLADPGPLLPRLPLLFCVVLPEALLALAAATALLLPLGGGVEEAAALDTAGELL